MTLSLKFAQPIFFLYLKNFNPAQNLQAGVFRKFKFFPELVLGNKISELF